jgi:hypothetical protein
MDTFEGQVRVREQGHMLIHKDEIMDLDLDLDLDKDEIMDIHKNE